MENSVKKFNEIDGLYMEWISVFLKDKAGFTSDIYKYNDYGVSRLNIENVSKLETFFRMIEKYADENNILPDGKEGTFITNKKYYVKYNDDVYAIGYISENETVFYCAITMIENNNDTIEYDKIKKFYNIKNSTNKDVGTCENRKKVKHIKNNKNEYKKKIRIRRNIK